MIDLMYCSESNRWYQKSTYRYLYWGKDQKRLYPPPSSFSTKRVIQIESAKNSIRPLVGIIAGTNPFHHFSGNASIFKDIQREITNHGGLSYVFTPGDVYRTHIQGYLYDEDTKKWTGYHFPYPNVIYNRIPDREEELTNMVSSLFALFKQKDIPFFNRSFFQKLDIFSYLSSHEYLTLHIPETIELTIENLDPLLHKFPSVFCKPSSGSKGRGIFRVKKLPTGYQYEDHEMTRYFSSITALHTHIAPFLHEKYLVQKEIQLSTYNNHPYDFRIMLQKPLNYWTVTGIGIRVGFDNSLTTHVPRGGRIVAFHKLADEKDSLILTKIAILAAEVIEEREDIKECSMDIGKDTDGHFWIFEANSKPMRFDEPAIHREYIQSLISTFRTFSAF
ncbi:YheC/YheD family protein [Pseudalkalibacillus hwajinpoensis]|uniref:YheC/YheD family endospore coat-associated protein n=1 Tax=Guptibacillus hwajinpoensis TaxID=208199 RepID=UPI00325B7B55